MEAFGRHALDAPDAFFFAEGVGVMKREKKRAFVRQLMVRLPCTTHLPLADEGRHQTLNILLIGLRLPPKHLSSDHRAVSGSSPKRS